MAGKPVALEDDIVIEASNAHTNPNYQGTWTAASVVVEAYDRLTVGGSPVVHEVRVDFTFTGTDTSSGATVTDTSSVTLAASPTLITVRGGPVLVDGDTADDAHGNTVRVASSQHLRTA